MPPNTGTPPKHDRCDIRFRNGRVIRNTLASKWRWKPWGWGESEWDIESWQSSAVEKR